jgi:hypothetical protein
VNRDLDVGGFEGLERPPQAGDRTEPLVGVLELTGSADELVEAGCHACAKVPALPWMGNSG